jgi:hypothetical protein
MLKTVTLRLDERAYTALLEAAKAEKRPLANLIENAALAKIAEQQFADDGEVAEILVDDALVKRIKRGSREARLRKGRFVG